jgi:hypothetical protein
MVAIEVKHPEIPNGCITRKIIKLLELYSDHITGQPVISFYSSPGCNTYEYRYMIGFNKSSKVEVKLIINNRVYNDFDMNGKLKQFRLKIENAIIEQALEEL